MSIDLRSEKVGGTWTRRVVGDHEENGILVSTNDRSARISATALQIMFEIDRADIPAAWADRIDVVELRAELLAAIVRRMSIEVLEQLFSEVHALRQRAFLDGENAAKSKIKAALGL